MPPRHRWPEKNDDEVCASGERDHRGHRGYRVDSYKEKVTIQDDGDDADSPFINDGDEDQ
jgi:hypothetical protein